MQDMHTRRRVPGATGQINSINRVISLAEDGLLELGTHVKPDPSAPCSLPIKVCSHAAILDGDFGGRSGTVIAADYQRCGYIVSLPKVGDYYAWTPFVKADNLDTTQ